MAYLESRSGWYRVVFRIEGERFSKSLNTKCERSAEACLVRVKDNLHRYELGLLSGDEEQDIASIIIEDGQKKPKRNGTSKSQKSITIKKAWKLFNDTLPANSLEQSTLSGMATHVEHLARLIGKQFTLSQIDKPMLQSYIDKRSKEDGRNDNNVSVQTIKKELRTFSTIWGWMKDRKRVSIDFPGRRLRFPKYQDKPVFQTWQQIESRIKRCTLTKYQIKELWETLFLDVRQVEQVLTHVKTHARHAVVYPMMAFVAYTGARRSECLRSEIEDVDFENSVITIREKKRLRGRLSTRRVPMQPKLRAILEEWLASHPGSNFTFSSIRYGASHATPVSNDQASNFFEKTFAKSKWDKLHGWHVFRHSFCSNCAAAGIDQRVVMQWAGHQTEQMARRYLHLFPSNDLLEIQKVFG